MNKNDRKQHYNKKGMYAGYDKKHKEREALDFYSTPIEEVANILDYMNLDFNNKVVLEPCAGAGHMSKAIWDYINDNHMSTVLINTDIKERKNQFSDDINIGTGEMFDFLSDDYPINNADYIIMNPPYSVIEPFVMKALGIADKGVLMLGRLQFLESEKRYENIFKEYPPTDVYIYVDRISCYKNGDTKQKMASVQAYAWFYWDLNNSHITQLHWIRRFDKK